MKTIHYTPSKFETLFIYCHKDDDAFMGVAKIGWNLKTHTFKWKKNTWGEKSTFQDKIWDAPLGQRGMVSNLSKIWGGGCNLKDPIWNNHVETKEHTWDEIWNSEDQKLGHGGVKFRGPNNRYPKIYGANIWGQIYSENIRKRP